MALISPRDSLSGAARRSSAELSPTTHSAGIPAALSLSAMNRAWPTDTQKTKALLWDRLPAKRCHSWMTMRARMSLPVTSRSMAAVSPGAFHGTEEKSVSSSQA